MRSEKAPIRPRGVRPNGGVATFQLCLCLTFGLAASGSLISAEPVLTGDRIPTREGDLIVHPVNHATLVLGWQKLVVYVDPVGGATRFAGLPQPDLVLLTDTHGDHLHLETLKSVAGKPAAIVAPPAVAEQLPAELRGRTSVLTNGASVALVGLKIEAVPAYNLSPDREKFHARGRGNGYVVAVGGLRVYLSGDTEDIPEMRSLKDIGVAFVCMNLPYTMTVDQAASAVREFRPKIVYPYHCRGSDLEKFKTLVGDSVGVEVRLRDWYKR